MTPKFSELNNKFYQNTKIFQRINTIYKSLSKSKLSSEQKRLVEVYYKNFVREGAKADSKNKKRIAEINKELATLFTKFSQNQLADESNYYVELNSEATLMVCQMSSKMQLMKKQKKKQCSWTYCQYSFIYRTILNFFK
jgi:peptidyl-dipeptidase Dcp